MKEKRVFYCELAYILGIIVLAIGTAFMEKADFGLSMIVAPAYILHLKVSEYLPFFTFGVAEYVFQALLLVILAVIMRGFKKSYLFSFVTAIIYGTVLDLVIQVVRLIPLEGFGWQCGYFVVGLIICTTGVALLLNAHFPPEAYELIVKEISAKKGIPLGKVKTAYDFFSCGLGILLSLLFFGSFVGVKWGTIVSTVFNGLLISTINRFLNNRFVFKVACFSKDEAPGAE